MLCIQWGESLKLSLTSSLTKWHPLRLFPMPHSITPATVRAEFLSRKEASQLLNISEAWIRKMERAGTGPERVRFGKCVPYSRTALLAFAQARLVRA